MIDHFSADMLSSNDNWNTLTESHNGITTSHHTHMGDNVYHYDGHQYDGYSNHFGNNVFHHDANGMMSGHSNMLGDTVTHYDNHNMVAGYDRQIGNQIMHFDSHNNLVSRTDAFGHTFSASGTLIGNHNKF